MRTRRRWLWLGIVSGILALGWALYTQLDLWNARGQLRIAQEEIARGRLEMARRRLNALSARRGPIGGTANYWLGICEALGNRSEAALRAFARVPEAYDYEPFGAYHEAKANLSQGRLHAAERRLEQAQSRGGPGLDRIRELLGEIYQIEVRFNDVKPLLRAHLAEADDPIPDLKELSNFDLERIPYDGLRATLEKAGQLEPADDRVWLGKARLAIEAGRWEEAGDWLRRCRIAGADAPVWTTWLEWARGTGRPEEALEAVRHLNQTQLDPGERLALWAWLHQQRGDRQAESAALERWLQVEPTAIQAIERLAVLAHQGGQPERLADLRHRKAEIERGMQAYRRRLWCDQPLRTAEQRFELARMAEAVDCRHEARALYAWTLRAKPGDPSAREALDRLDRDGAQRSRFAHDVDLQTQLEPAPVARYDQDGPSHRLIAGPAFTDDAEAFGLRFVYDNAETSLHQLPEPFGGGLALLDYDGDGWLDVFCVQGGPFAHSPEPGSPSPALGDRLFHNRGDGTFEDASDRSGISRFPRGHGHGAAVGDIDGDGRPDLFITRWRSYGLYRNRGDGTFEDVTDTWGLGGRKDWPTSAALADLDGDGDLDLYVCHYAAWDLDNPRICRDPTSRVYLNCNPLDAEALGDRLFRNDGGRFVEVTAESGVVDRDGRGLGVVAADLDDDGRVDLFVANDSSANFLFRNLGGMRFEEVGHTAGVASNSSGIYQAGMGVAAGDLDGDGLIDLAVTNFYGEATTFYRNLGRGVFTDASASIGLTVASRRLLGFGVSLLDVDNDGRLDLASANGHVNDLRPNYPYRMTAQLLLGGADGHLTDVSDQAGSPWRVPRIGRGLAVGDLDNDGREDLLILSHNQPLAYFHNRTRGGRFLTLRLEGRESNRDAVGAKVTVVAAGRRRVAWRIGGGSYQSAADPRIHFGLNEIDRIDAVVVNWPSGRVDRYLGLQVDACYLLREGDDQPKPLEGFREVAGNPDSSYAR